MKERKFREPLLDKWNRKYGRYAPRNIMLFIVVVTALVWLLDTIVLTKTNGKFYIADWLDFNRELILQGQAWRLITFVFIPTDDRLIYLALSLYFYWLIGDSLEEEWGALRFDLFYLCGVIGSIISGFITGFATNYYLNLSLFLAYAIMYPDNQFLLFFFIPIKAKYLAIFDFLLLLVDFIVVSYWAYRLAIIMSLLNIILFFWKNYWQKIKTFFRRRKFKREAKRDESEYPFDL